jgi:hypothetical protein
MTAYEHLQPLIFSTPISTKTNALLACVPISGSRRRRQRRLSRDLKSSFPNLHETECPAVSSTKTRGSGRPRNPEISARSLGEVGPGTGVTTMPVVAMQMPAEPIERDVYGELLSALGAPGPQYEAAWRYPDLYRRSALRCHHGSLSRRRSHGWRQVRYLCANPTRTDA